MGNYSYLIAIALLPLAGWLFNRFIGWLEGLAFKHLPHGRFRSLLISGWSSGKTPETLEEMKEQRGL